MNKNVGMVNFSIAEDLSMASIKVLLTMAEEMDSRGRVIVSVKELANKTGYSERSIKRAIKELKTSDAIEKEDTVYSVSGKYVKRGVR